MSSMREASAGLIVTVAVWLKAIEPFTIAVTTLSPATELPMVPIVLENAGELMWRHDATVRPGTVSAVVHPPIDTGGWSVETLDEHVAQVRDIFLTTLGLEEKQ